jgi:hypothetical protein
VTDTASAAASKFVDYLVGASSKFSVNKSGDITFAGNASGGGSGLTGIPESGVTSLVSDLAAKAATATTVTIAGTANQITSSAGAQDLSANRTWTLSLPQNIHTAATPGVATGTRLGLGAAADATFEFLLEADALGVTANHGATLKNTTAAAAGAQQYSARS